MDFHNKWSREARQLNELPISNDLKLRSEMEMPWFEFHMPDFPAEEILKEVKALKSEFVEHRPGEGHEGWKSLCLHGIFMTQTMCAEDYGLKDRPEIYKWTEAAEMCPVSTKYFETVYPAEAYKRIRIMLVESGGFILPHRDREKKSLGPLTIPLNVPENCHLSMDSVGRLPFRKGFGYLMDISNVHSVWNRSVEDRFHIIVEANYESLYRKFLGMIFKSYERKFPLRRFVNPKYRHIRPDFKDGNFNV